MLTVNFMPLLMHLSRGNDFIFLMPTNKLTLIFEEMTSSRTVRERCLWMWCTGHLQLLSAVLVFIPYLWISIIHLWISMDIHN